MGVVMPPAPKQFTQQQIATVRRMKSEGHSMSEIANAIGVGSSSTLNWFIRRGAFGVLPKCQGQRQPRKTYKDDERTGQLFGQRKQDWERRLKGVQAGWSPDEEQRRQKGVMPLGEVPYGLRQRHKGEQWGRS